MVKWQTVLFLFLLAGPSVSAARAEPFVLVGFGDSLMAGYQLPAGDGFTGKLQEALRAAGHDVEVVNAGVSGDTTSGGLSRLDWSVGDDADGVILELGANDALRGIDPDLVESNLDAMITRLKQRGIPVLLAGMMAPPNLGDGYAERYDAIFPRLADKHDLVFYPFFLDGVAAQEDLNLDDGMHPNARGIETMVERFLPYAERFLEAAGAG